MSEKKWMLYGANGYTGKLLIQEAILKGHKPILAGRSAEKLKLLSEKYNLEYRTFDLKDPSTIEKHIDGVSLVLHSAGPFSQTAKQMLNACLKKKIHYTDITGEINVFKNTFSHNLSAKENQIVLMSGIGYDVVPTDCLAKYVSEKANHPIDLTIAFAGINKPSIGTLKSMLESVNEVGTLVRRNSVLKPIVLGTLSQQILFPNGEKDCLPISWGDLETAYHSTGIPNITTLMSVPSPVISFLSHARSVIQLLLNNQSVVDSIKEILSIFYTGPSQKEIEEGKTYIYAEAKGDTKFAAFLETREAYYFTAQAAILIVDKILQSEGSLAGAYTPSMAFGSDLVLEIEGVLRWDVP